MNQSVFKASLITIALVFTLVFLYLVVPPLSKNPDIIGAFAAGFVNPYSSGYSIDVIMCWNVLAIWVWYEAITLQIKNGWIALVLGIVPGVAVGFPVYLLLRMKQLETREKN